MCCLFFGCKNTRFNSTSLSLIKQESGIEENVINQFNLELLTLGKNTIEVESLMGAPEGQTLGQNGEHLWDYRRPVLDDETGKVFDWSLITFHFNQGRCNYIDILLSSKPEQLFEEEK